MNTAFFIVLVFGASFIVFLVLVSMGAGSSRKHRKRVKARLDNIEQTHKHKPKVSIRRERYLHSLSPLEQRLESMPGMDRLRQLVEQSGRNVPAYKVFLICVGLGLFVMSLSGLIIGNWMIAFVLGLLFSALPIYKLSHDRQTYMNRFEEQLPDALDTMSRALKAGHPFSEAMHLVSEEMNDPIAKEFGQTFAEMNYGYDFRTSMLNLLERVPSISLMAVVASVLIQRETGGNLSEVIGKISAVIRSRFQLQRKVKTMSAEGKMSAWILSLLPFVLMVMIHAVNPTYLPMLFNDPMGKKLIVGAIVAMGIGIIWMRKIIRIEL